MLKNKLMNILSLNGISILIGIVGGIIGLLAIFIDDWNYMISIRWFALLIIIFLFIFLITAKLAYEFYRSSSKLPVSHIKAISYLSLNSTLLIAKSELLEYSARVTIFYVLNDFQIEVAQGFVDNIQENFVQVKITQFNTDFLSGYESIAEGLKNNNGDVLKKLIIKNYIRYNEPL